VLETPFAGCLEPDASPPGRVVALEEQILRLQYLVSYLLEANEGLRQQLADGTSGDLVSPFELNGCGIHIGF
jgi:hypothetical protein